MRKEIKTFIKVFFGMIVGSILYYLLAFVSLVIAYSGYKMASNAGATNFPHNISLGKKRMFQPVEIFQGPYSGYIFTTGEQGTGYYPDNYQGEEDYVIKVNTPRIILGNIIFFAFSSISFILLLPIIIDSFIRILTFFALDEMF